MPEHRINPGDRLTHADGTPYVVVTVQRAGKWNPTLKADVITVARGR